MLQRQRLAIFFCVLLLMHDAQTSWWDVALAAIGINTGAQEREIEDRLNNLQDLISENFEEIKKVGTQLQDGFDNVMNGLDNNAQLITAGNELLQDQIGKGFDGVAKQFDDSNRHTSMVGNYVLQNTLKGLDNVNQNVLANGAKIDFVGQQLGAKMDTHHGEVMQGIGGLAVQANRNTNFLANHISAGVDHLSNKIDQTQGLIVNVGGQLSQQMDQNHGQVMSGLSQAIQEGREQTNYLSNVINTGINSVNQNIHKTQNLVVDVGQRLSGQMSQQHGQVMNTLGAIYDQGNRNTAFLSNQMSQGFNSVNQNIGRTQQLVAQVGQHLSGKLDQNRQVMITGFKGLSAQGIQQTRLLSDQMNRGFNGVFQGLEANFEMTKHVGETLLREMKADTIATQKLIRNNADLTIGVGTYLSHQLSDVQADMTGKLATVMNGIAINNNAIENFRQQALKGFDIIVDNIGIARNDIANFRHDLGVALGESFTAVQNQLIAHYQAHSDQIQDVKTQLSHQIHNVLKATGNLADLTLTGFYRSEKLLNRNAALMQKMHTLFMEKMSASISISLSNNAKLMGIQDGLDKLRDQMSAGFEKIEKTIKSEAASIKTHSDEKDLTNSIVIRLNSTMITMLTYLDIHSSLHLQRFTKQFRINGVNTIKNLILSTYEKRLTNLIDWMSAQDKFDYRQYEHLRDTLLRSYDIAYILSAFYDFQQNVPRIDFIKTLRSDINKYLVGVDTMLGIDKQLRDKVAFADFKEHATKYLTNSVQDVDDTADIGDVAALLRSIQKKLNLRTWHGTKTAVNNYIVFSTGSCTTLTSKIYQSSKHFFTHTNSYKMKFYLYRHRHEMNLDESWALKQSILNKLAMLEPANIETWKNASHNAVTNMCSCANELCTPKCKVVLTTGNCFITDSSNHNFGVLVGSHKRQRMFIGF